MRGKNTGYIFIREFIDGNIVDKLPYIYTVDKLPYYILSHGLEPTLMTCGSFGAVRLAAARPLFSQPLHRCY